MAASNYAVDAQRVARRALEAVNLNPRLSGLLFGGAIVATIALSWGAAVAVGGTDVVGPAWFAIPVVLAAYRFGRRGTALVAIAATIAAGPMTPDHVDNGSAVPQMTSMWLTRGIAFMVLGQVFVSLFIRLRRDRECARQELLERARLEHGLARHQAMFAAVVGTSSELTVTVTADGSIDYLSPSCAKVLMVGDKELSGSSFATLVHPDDRDAWRAALARSTRQLDDNGPVEWRLRRSDGMYVQMESQINNFLADPLVARVVVNAKEVGERRRLEHELSTLEQEVRHLAFHDSLTGLANRALFMDRLQQALHRLERTTGYVGVLFVDLDDFKEVNDRYGHSAGDDVLMGVGRRLREVVRIADTVARFGGDEFGVLVECNEPSDANRIAERIHGSLRSPFAISDGETFVRASIGIVTTSDSQILASELLRQSDVAMYAAKNAGKGRSQSFHKQLYDRVIRRLELQSDLALAIERRELVIHYQPIVDVETGRVKGVEALVRWHHPERGLIPPNEFIPLAESTGMITSIGRWLLNQACHDMTALQRDPDCSDLELSVNISARELEDTRVVYEVTTALANSGLRPGRLTLEITESTVMTDADRALVVLQQLKSLGVKLSIDDFGTGYSSLAYLQKLPVDELKIDRAFIAATESGNPDSTNLIRTIAQLANSFGLSTVAEGIETEDQLARARVAGCNLAQGYLFARPTEVRALRRVLRDIEAAEGRGRS